MYDHHERQLAERLTEIQHAHHELTMATMHAHLDHKQCLETVMLKGPVKAVRALANALMAERGVRHGQLNVISVSLDSAQGDSGISHRHLRPHH